MTAEERIMKAIFGEELNGDAYEVKSTKGIEKNMHNEIDNLVRKAYNEGYVKGREAGAKSVKMDEDKLAEIRGEGVLELWNTLNAMVDEKFLKKSEVLPEAYVVDTRKFTDWMLDTLKSCPFELFEADEKCEEKSIEVGDIVLDPSGRKCTVTNTDTHIHVVYEDGKTHKWKKDAKFEQTGERAKIIGYGELGIAEEVDEHIHPCCM